MKDPVPVALQLLWPMPPGWSCIRKSPERKWRFHLSPGVRVLPGDKLSACGKGAQRAVDQLALLVVDGGRKYPVLAALPLLRPVPTDWNVSYFKYTFLPRFIKFYFLLSFNSSL